MMMYQSLTQAQREQVASLFADDLIGIDPALFEYEFDDNTVTRRRIEKTNGTIHAKKPRQINVNMVIDYTCTPEGERTLRSTIHEIARRIVMQSMQISISQEA